MRQGVAIALVLVSFAASAAVAVAQEPRPVPTSAERSFASLGVEPGARIETTAITAPGLSPLEAATCVANAFAPCLNNARFRVQVIFSAPSLGIQNQAAQAVVLTGDTAYFWFFTNNNIEIVLKVVDGRAFNGYFWVFYGAMSDVQYTITVTDTQTNAVKTYSNAAGSLASVADVTAFSGSAGCAFTVGSPTPSSFGAAGGSGTVVVTTSAGCTFNATSNSSGLTITSGLSYTGTATVTFQVLQNSATTSRTLSMTLAGQTVTIPQAGQATGGIYDGTWVGTTNQTCDPASGPPAPCPVTWVISSSRLVRFEIHYAGPACGVIEAGATITYTAPGREFVGNTFNIAGNGGSPVHADLNVTTTLNSAFAASGSGTVTLTTLAPLPSCTTTVPISYTATKN